MPIPLSVVVRHYIEGGLAGLRAAYAHARVALSGAVSPRELDEVLAAIEAQGARLVQAEREVALVSDHLLSRSPHEGR